MEFIFDKYTTGRLTGLGMIITALWHLLSILLVITQGKCNAMYVCMHVCIVIIVNCMAILRYLLCENWHCNHVEGI